jgi:hypothetical protein
MVNGVVVSKAQLMEMGGAMVHLTTVNAHCLVAHRITDCE